MTDSPSVQELNKMVSEVLMASFLYYCKGISVLDDKQFDRMIFTVGENVDRIAHMHKYLLDDTEVFTSQSLFHLQFDDYPTIVRTAARMWYNEIK